MKMTGTQKFLFFICSLDLVHWIPEEETGSWSHILLQPLPQLLWVKSILYVSLPCQLPPPGSTRLSWYPVQVQHHKASSQEFHTQPFVLQVILLEGEGWGHKSYHFKAVPLWKTLLLYLEYEVSLKIRVWRSI